MQTASHTLRRFLSIAVAGILLAAGTHAATPEDEAKAARFETLLAQIQRDIRAARETDITELLALADVVSRPYSASLAVKQYLTQNADASADLLLLAARNAVSAGDLRTAVSRYKNYLKQARPGAESSRAAADLVALLVDFLRVNDDAYRFMTENAGRFREDPSLRRFDRWYLAAARERQNYADMARYLTVLLKEKKPLPEERAQFWDELQWLIRAMSVPGDKQQQALSDFEILIPLIREDPALQSEAALYDELAQFAANGKATDPQQRAANFAKVVTAARRYFDSAPSLGTLRNICLAFGGGADAFDAKTSREDWAQKGDVLAHAFGKLSDADRDSFLAWENAGKRMAVLAAPPAKWSAIARAVPAWFKDNTAAGALTFGATYADKAQYAADAAALVGVPGRSAALIRAVAAGADAKGAVDHLFTQELWHLALTDPLAMVADDLVAAYRGLGGESNWDGLRDELLTYAMAKYVRGSPILMADPDGVREALQAVWRYSDAKNARAAIVPLIGGLGWVPYDGKVRRAVLEPVYADFRRWADSVRRSADEDQKKQIAQIDAAFRGEMGKQREQAVDPAPDELTKLLAAVLGSQAKKADQASATKALYAMAKGYPVQKTPFAGAILRTIMQAGTAPYEVQVELLRDQLMNWQVDGPNAAARLMLDTLVTSNNLRWWGSNRNDMKKAEALNAALADAMNRLLDQKAFSSELMNWFRGTRRGANWSDNTMNQAVLARMIREQTLIKHDYVSTPQRNNAAVYMQLVRNEFNGLVKEFPVETYFDDMFVAEATAKGYLDYSYWSLGRDEKHKIADLAAEMLKGYATLPLGYGASSGPQYTYGELMQWHARAMDAAPASRDAMLAAAEAAYGATRFDPYAMGVGYFETQAKAKDAADRKAFFDKLAAYLDRAALSRGRVGPPNLKALQGITGSPLSGHELDVLLSIFSKAVPATWPADASLSTLVHLLEGALIGSDRVRDLPPQVRHFWKICRDTNDTDLERHLVQKAQAFVEAGEHHLAIAYSLSGSDVMSGRMAEMDRAALQTVKSKALAKVASEVPFDRSDRRYPIYAAQVAYLTENEQDAWDGYLKNQAAVRAMFKELDPGFCTWIIKRHTAFKQFAEAESLARPMILWMDENPKGFGPEIRASLYLAYAGIAFGQQEYPKARAQYERIAATEDFDATQAQRDAMLQIAEVDRQTKNYDAAVAQLEKLARRHDEYLQKEANYQLGVVKFDQEDYGEAADFLAKVFAIDPDHADGRILEAKIFLKMKKLIEATDVKIGHLASQRYLVPGMPLKVKLEDPNRTIVGRGVEVRIVAWTKSGDKESFSLLPIGDAQTRFEGQVPTALAPLAVGDGILQVLGDDIIQYDYSEAFKQASQIKENAPSAISVASDSTLYASSGRIVTHEEQEQQALERMIRQKLEIEETVAGVEVALSTVRSSGEVKPGNPINVRIADLDRSVTAGLDEIPIEVTAASGDRIAAFMLKETETHSGVFEGAVPTDSSEAVAYATDSDEGSDPNFAISAGDYPAWTALPDSRRPKVYTFDIYDNILPASMKVVADVPGRRIKQLLLQTSLNGKTFTSEGSYPALFQPWDGAPRVTIARYKSTGRMPTKAEDLQKYLEGDFALVGERLHYGKHANFSVSWDENVGGFAQQLALAADGADSWYVARLSGGFYTEKREMRTFELVPVRTSPDAMYFLTIDGEAPPVSRDPDVESKMAITKAFKKGVHYIEVYICANRRARPAVELRFDTTEPPYMVACPAAMFDAAAVPEIGEVLARKPAEISLNDAGTVFDVAFDQTAARARVFKLHILDYETDAPAIDRIELTDREGRQLLPSKQDLMALRHNNKLEIVPGDVITIMYKDPKFLTKNRQVQAAKLRATFYNATVSACFTEVQYRGDARSETYIPLRRYEPGDALTLFVNDPDMDTTDGIDKISLTVQTSAVGSKPVVIEAVETEEHSGVFTKRVFPISGKATRDSELPVEEGDDLILSYLDNENTDPGIPWRRTFACEQIWYQDPELRVFNVASMDLSALPEGKAKATGRPAPAAAGQEGFVPTRTLVMTRPERPDLETPAEILLNGPIVAEIVWPTIAKSPRSSTDIYVQTLSGLKRKMGLPLDTVTNIAAPKVFDTTVPGTIKRTVGPSAFATAPRPAGYAGSVIVAAGRPLGTPLDVGCFTLALPLTLGDVPETSLVDEKSPRGGTPPLTVRGDDKLVVGFQYVDDLGTTNWMTQLVNIGGDAFFDVMDQTYDQLVENAYVGETLYFQVLDLQKDTSPDKDVIKLHAKASSGAEGDVRLVETLTHSGIFKGYTKLSYGTNATAETASTVSTSPVKYGDTLTMTYASDDAATGIAHNVFIYRGADGVVWPFTRRFKDPEIAVQTQFTLAEAYFELAKRHRDMGEDELSRLKIAQGKKMLEEALRDFPDTGAHVQADYLLANLAFEFSKDATNPEIQRQYQIEAINKFSAIVAKYGDSEYAPKAQYKKGVVYEKMGEMDRAAEEYVKLSYRYPDNMLVAETIARLGQYFLLKGKAILAKMEPVEDPIEREKIKMEAYDVFRTAGQVFGRLGKRFPQHSLAGKTGVLSGQCFMRGEMYKEAIEAFKVVVDNAENLEPELVAEAMFWCGESYLKLVENYDPTALMEAYKMYTRLRWDYPETTWAKHARGRLAQKELANVAKDKK